MLADPIRTSNPQLEPQQHFTWKLNFTMALAPMKSRPSPSPAIPPAARSPLPGQAKQRRLLPSNATAAAVASALKALSNIGDNDVTVTGPAAGREFVTFVGALAETDVAQMTGNGGSLTGTYNEIQLVTITGAPTGGTFTLTWSGQTTSALAYNASAAQVQAALRLLSNINGANVNVTGDDGGPYTVEFVGTWPAATVPK